MIQADQPSEPQFTQPVYLIVAMAILTVVIFAAGYWFQGALMPIFLANVPLNGFISLVFLFGIASCFWQMRTVVLSVSWVEGFALNRPGHEFVEPPGLLAPLANLLRKRGARASLTASSTQSIQDSVATRLDESREITRYIINLLIFLGLLGTFFGLATTVPAVVDTIRSLAPQEDGNSINVFDNLMAGLEKQLGGMGTAFGSSLIGLAGSLVVGLLDLLAGRGQNRFYAELEEWLSSITRIGLSGGDAEGEGGSVDSFAIADMLEHTTVQMEAMREVLMQAQQRRDETDDRVERLARSVDQLADLVKRQDSAEGSVMKQISHSQSQIAEALNRMSQQPAGDQVWDTEARAKLRNIDSLMLKIYEEMSTQRIDAIGDLHTEIGKLTETLKEAVTAAEEEG